jgi:cation transport ATPase
MRDTVRTTSTQGTASACSATSSGLARANRSDRDLGAHVARVLGYSPPQMPGAHLIAPVFGTIVFFYGGWPFVQGAVRELRARLPGMMTLIALAIAVAFVFSVAVTLGYPGMPLWEELATLVTIMLLGHWIEMRSITQAQGALAELAKLLPNTAVRIVHEGAGERMEDVPLTALGYGDLVLVRPGANVPADGVVREGHSSINESMITGESRPVEKNPGDRVIAGTVNQAGSLRVAVTGTGDRTTLAGIMRLVEQAQSSRSRAQALADLSWARLRHWLTWSESWRRTRTRRPYPRAGARWRRLTLERVFSQEVTTVPARSRRAQAAHMRMVWGSSSSWPTPSNFDPALSFEIAGRFFLAPTPWQLSQ